MNMINFLTFIIFHKNMKRIYQHVLKSCTMTSRWYMTLFCDTVAQVLGSQEMRGLIHLASKSDFVTSHQCGFGQLTSSLRAYVPKYVRKAYYNLSGGGRVTTISWDTTYKSHRLVTQ